MNQSPPFVVFLVVQFFLRRSGLGERSVKHQDYISLYIDIFIYPIKLIMKQRVQ